MQALRLHASGSPLVVSRTWIARVVLVAPAIAIVLLWWPSLSGSFQFDDWNVIVEESRVHSLAAWWASMPGIRPLLKLTYALNYALGGAEPYGFRLLNVLIHALSAVLVSWLLRVRGIRAGLSPSQAMWAAFLAGLVFALHPVQTEAVTYISGRSSSLAACFCLISLCCWVKNEDTSGSRSGMAKAMTWMVACSLAYVAAVACKETAVVLPLALLLYSADRPLRPTLVRLAPLFVLTLAVLWVAMSLPTYRHLLAVSLQTRSVGENLLTQSHALFYLAGQLVRVWNGNADPQLVVATGVEAVSVMLSAAWALALTAALACVRRAPVGAFAVLWFLLWLAPTNSLLPRLDPANDRQLYLALIGPAWWVAVRLMTLPRGRDHIAVLVLGLALIGIATLSVATLERNRIYDTEVTFWEDAALHNPNNARAANNLGMAYALSCRQDKALGEFERAMALDSSDYRARINRALLLKDQLPGAEMTACSARQN